MSDPPRDNALDWGLVGSSLARPYRVPASMVLLWSLVPLYILVPELLPPPVRHTPAVALDRALPLVPFWAIVYGVLYLFLILLPFVVVRHDDLIRRTVSSYLFIWLTAYACFFVIYPTAAPRPDTAYGEGFALWGLQALYSTDPPYNCFPSIHVAHSLLSALACSRVHRRVGVVATVAAALVATSTLFTKPHYVLDAVAGGLLACVAYAIFLRRFPTEEIPDLDRRAAPGLALCVGAVAAVALAGSWIAYLATGAGALVVLP